MNHIAEHNGDGYFNLEQELQAMFEVRETPTHATSLSSEDSKSKHALSDLRPKQRRENFRARTELCDENFGRKPEQKRAGRYDEDGGF